MELYDAIKTIVDTFGKEIIAERRFLNMIADYHSFMDNPAEKRVLSVIVNDGYTDRLLNINSDDDVSIPLNQIVDDVCRNYGFRKDLVLALVNIIITNIGLSAPQSVITPVPSDNNNHTYNSDQIYSEAYIMSLYPILFKDVPHHAHMDFDIFQNKINLDSKKAFQLFRFLKGMRAYTFNVNSDDYDMEVDSENDLRALYRNYVTQLKTFEIPISMGKTIKREDLEKIIKRLYKFKFISEEEINIELSSLQDHKELFFELFIILKQLKVVDDNGRSLNPFLTPEAMVNYIITTLVPHFNGTLMNEAHKHSGTVSLSSIMPLAQPYECLLTEEYIVSLYSPLFSRYAHTDAHRIQEELNIKDEEVYKLIHFLEKIKAIRYNRYSQDYDICVFSEAALQKQYREWKKGIIIQNKPHLLSLQKIEGGLEHLIKLKFTNVALLAKNLQTDDNKAAVVFQVLIHTKIINDKGALINPYLGVKAIAKKVWRKC